MTQSLVKCVIYLPLTDRSGRPYRNALHIKKQRIIRHIADGFQGPEDVALLRDPTIDAYEELPTGGDVEPVAWWHKFTLAVPSADVDRIRTFVKRCHGSFGFDRVIPLVVQGVVESIARSEDDDETLDRYDDELPPPKPRLVVTKKK